MFKSPLFHSLLLCSLFSLGFGDGSGSSHTKDFEKSHPRDRSKATDNDEDCAIKARPVRITMRHIENRGIGYNTGYTTLEGFFAPCPTSTLFPFIDLRGHIFNDNKWAANGGLGLRYLPNNIEVVFGVNAYYDFRHVSHKSFHQVGAGLEFLGHVWEGRINGYLPFSHKRGPYSELKFDKFKGNEIILQRRADFAMKGLDAEAGAYLLQLQEFDLFFGAGPYGYAAERGKAAIGGKARLTANFSEYVTAEVTSSYDSVFRGIVQGELMINIPIYTPKKIQRQKGSFKSCDTWSAMHDRLLDRIYRQEIIVVKKEKRHDVAIDPTTGLPFTVLFVNNTSHSAGTFESPFSTLLDAQNASEPNDIIYVYSGDGTSNGMNAGIILQDNQRLWGASTRQQLTTTLGNIVVPPHDTIAPIITNSSFGVVEIANNNEISGFTIQNNTIEGIVQLVTTTSLSNLRVLNNSIIGTGAGSAIDAGNLQGTITVYNNSINQVEGAAAKITSVAAPSVNITFQDNTINTSGDGVDINLNQFVDSNINLFNNSIILAAGTGTIIQIQYNNGDTEGTNFLNISNNNLVGQGSGGVIVGLIDGTLENANISNNIISSPTTQAFSFGTEGQATAELSILNNNITAGTNGMNIFSDFSDTSSVNASVISNNVSAATGDGLVVFISGAGTVQCDVLGNIFNITSSNLGSAATFQNDGSGGGTICLSFNENTANFVTPSPYEFANTAGNNFFVTPPINNIGDIFESGTITQVTTLPCGL